MLIFWLFSNKYSWKLVQFLDSDAIILHGRLGAAPLIVAVVGSKPTRDGHLSTVTGIPLHKPFIITLLSHDMTEIL